VKTNKQTKERLGWNALAYMQYPSLFAKLILHKTMWMEILNPFLAMAARHSRTDERSVPCCFCITTSVHQINFSINFIPMFVFPN
jgi:hypothetical protein